MKKVVLILSMAFIAISVSAQICFQSPRGMVDLPLDHPEGYVGGFSLDIPGENLIAKGDSCLTRLFEQFGTELVGIVLDSGKVLHGTVFQSVRYKQLLNGILLNDHGAYFRFDMQNRLIGVRINLALDTAILAELEDLAELGYPGKHKIVLTLNGYELRENIIPHDHPASCTAQGGEPIEMQVTFPSYEISCHDVTVNIDIPTAFDDDHPLRTLDNNKLCGKYANPDPDLIPTFQNGSGVSWWWYDCETPSNKHEALMAYYHLNYGFGFIEKNLVPYNGPSIKDVTFEYASNDEADLPIVESNMNGNEIRFSELPTGGDYNDIAEDADHVAGAAFEAYLVFNGIPIPIGQAEGVGAGTLAYWTWRYMVAQGFISHTNIGGWAGSDHISINLDNGLDEGDMENEENRLNASIWAGALFEIHNIFSTSNDEQVMYELVMNSILDWGDNSIDQRGAARILYDMAFLMTPLKISEAQLCGIREVLNSRYNQMPGLGISPSRDLYIKDTHEGIDIPGGGITGEDRGEEENLVSKLYDKSPNIWNCTTSDCNEHQRPVVGTTNYLKVLVSNEGCDWPNLEGNLEVYAAFTPTNERWPYDWGATDANQDGIPEYSYYYYGGSSVVVGKRIGVVDLDTYTEDPDGNGRIYSISWIPWNPFGSNKPWSPQLSFLARIIDTSEPFYDDTPLNDLALHYTKDNNNVARRKNSIFLFAAGGPIPTPSPVKISTMLGIGPIAADLNLSLSYTNTDIVYTASNFDSLGTISMIFPENLLALYGLDLPDETGFDWVNDSTIVITSPDFFFPLKADPDSIYQLQMRYTPSGTFQPVSFYLDLRDEDECSYGGEHFTINATGIAPRSDDPIDVIKPLVQIRPNPVDQVAYIWLGTDIVIKEISIFNTLGQVFQVPFNREEMSFSVSGLPAGLYYMTLSFDDGQKTVCSFVKYSR